MSYRVQIFSQQDDELGEGVMWHSQRNSLFWLDINHSKLYEKKIISEKLSFDFEWFLPEKASSIAMVAQNDYLLAMVTDKSFGIFNLLTQEYKRLIELPYTNDIRSNDGAVAPDGSYWFGSMERKPLSTKGSIYSVNANAQLQCHYSGIGIPNTFCWVDDDKYLIISDSLLQKQFKFDWSEGQIDTDNIDVFSDYSDSNSTPDGGAVDSKKLMWNALWGGEKVVARNTQGQLITEVMLPVLQPTNCCFGGHDLKTLFVTSAREGVCKSTLEKYPLSGSVFKVECDYPGIETPAFILNETY